MIGCCADPCSSIELGFQYGNCYSAVIGNFPELFLQWSPSLHFLCSLWNFYYSDLDASYSIPLILFIPYLLFSILGFSFCATFWIILSSLSSNFMGVGRNKELWFSLNRFCQLLSLCGIPCYKFVDSLLSLLAWELIFSTPPRTLLLTHLFPTFQNSTAAI